MSGSGSPLVLLHGAAMSGRIWRPVIPFLQPHHDVFAPTLPGHRGGPVVPAAPVTSLGVVADLLEAQLDGAGLGAVHVAGNSLGASLALELGRRGRALSVVAIAPPVVWRAERDVRRLSALLLAARLLVRSPLIEPALRFAAVRRVLLHTAVRHGDRVPADAVSELIADMRGDTVVDAIVAATRRAGHPDGFARFGCPVRVAWPQHDRTVPFPRWGAPLMERLDGVELVVVPGVGHVPMYDDPALVADVILAVTAPDRR